MKLKSMNINYLNMRFLHFIGSYITHSSWKTIFRFVERYSTRDKKHLIFKLKVSLSLRENILHNCLFPQIHCSSLFYPVTSCSTVFSIVFLLCSTLVSDSAIFAPACLIMFQLVSPLLQRIDSVFDTQIPCSSLFHPCSTLTYLVPPSNTCTSFQPVPLS